MFIIILLFFLGISIVAIENIPKLAEIPMKVSLLGFECLLKYIAST